MPSSVIQPTRLMEHLLGRDAIIRYWGEEERRALGTRTRFVRSVEGNRPANNNLRRKWKAMKKQKGKRRGWDQREKPHDTWWWKLSKYFFSTGKYHRPQYGNTRGVEAELRVLGWSWFPELPDRSSTHTPELPLSTDHTPSLECCQNYNLTRLCSTSWLSTSWC